MPKNIVVNDPSSADLVSVHIKRKDDAPSLVLACFELGTNYQGTHEVDLANIPVEVSDAFDVFIAHIIAEFKASNGF